ncbi:uncharacterized protein LOC8069848 isoform X3 [Sorghum bicolor]|uniref:Uncharacterized protein n=1 Tax=Sorghum bicolor TaxID=4558 RepID=A0A1Z5RA64_SORBI|nr:uncharacterized protein LOC8069848 isoform X3 [Sorghum bicolor]OQU80266.1 hypothetical protein SORBI_3007G102700 [Sorghum bicolor]|eukprot:XP_021320451.1 uncharacterized protein LOC8069848 isoform X3 [Sorghum bicolor]
MATTSGSTASASRFSDPAPYRAAQTLNLSSPSESRRRAMAAEPPEPASSQDAQLAASSSAALAGVGGPNPCCAKLWKKYQKLETSRTALREAVKLLQAENEKLQKENSELSKVQRGGLCARDVTLNKYKKNRVLRLQVHSLLLVSPRTLKNSPTVPVREWGIGYIVPYLQFLSFRNFLGVKFHGDGEHQTTGGAQGKRHKNTKGGSLIFLSATLALKKPQSTLQYKNQRLCIPTPEVQSAVPKWFLLWPQVVLLRSMQNIGGGKITSM